MRQLIFRFTLPLTLVLFGLITKWWYGIAIDAKDVFFYGFPLIYKCEGFHTSMSTQYFLFEMSINLITYFGFCLIITLIINRFWKINISKKIAKIFWIGFGVVFAGIVFLSIELNDVYLIKRNFNVKIFDNGSSIMEMTPDREKYLDQVKRWYE